MISEEFHRGCSTPQRLFSKAVALEGQRKRKCVAAPVGGAVKSTQPSVPSNPVFLTVKVYSVFLVTG